MPIDCDRIKEDSIINFIDKLIIGLLAAGIAFGVQFCIDKSTEARLQKLSVAKLESDELIKTKVDITTIMRNYLLLLETLKRDDFNAVNEDKLKLSNYHANLKFIMDMAGIFSPNLDTKTAPVLQKMSDINKEIRKVKPDTKIVKHNIDNLKNTYKQLISGIRDEAIKAIEKERKIGS